MARRSDPVAELVGLSALADLCAVAGLWRALEALRLRIRDFWYDHHRRAIEEGAQRAGTPAPGVGAKPTFRTIDSTVWTLRTVFLTPRQVGKMMTQERFWDPVKELPERTSSTPFVGWRAWFVCYLERLEELPHARIADGWRPDTPIKTVRDYYLHSIGVPVIWPGPVMHAGAPPANENPMGWIPHDPPEGQSHGIYAFNDAGLMERSLMSVVEILGSRNQPGECVGPLWGVACGAVELFGKVVVHKQGFRAEKARVRSLHLVHRHPAASPGDSLRYIRESLEERYRCDVNIPHLEGIKWPPVK